MKLIELFEDGPAVITSNGTKKWYKNGKLHREDGLAIEYSNGSEEWYVNGNKMRAKEFIIEKFNYVGNCINSFDENGECQFGIFSDVSDFAYHDENATTIKSTDFYKLANVPLPLKSLFNKYPTTYMSYDNGLLVAYIEPIWNNNNKDPNTDIHYFFENPTNESKKSIQNKKHTIITEYKADITVNNYKNKLLAAIEKDNSVGQIPAGRKFSPHARGDKRNIILFSMT